MSDIPAPEPVPPVQADVPAPVDVLRYTVINDQPIFIGIKYADGMWYNWQTQVRETFSLIKHIIPTTPDKTFPRIKEIDIPLKALDNAGWQGTVFQFTGKAGAYTPLDFTIGAANCLPWKQGTVLVLAR